MNETNSGEEYNELNENFDREHQCKKQIKKKEAVNQKTRILQLSNQRRTNIK